MQTPDDDVDDGTQRRHGDIFSEVRGDSRSLPLLLVGAPLRALLSRSPQRNMASPFARVEDGKVTSAEVKQPWPGLRISSVHTH